MKTSRREFMAGAVAGALIGREAMAKAPAVMPTSFVLHGGGPWPVLPMGRLDPAETQRLADYMRSIATLPPARPRALLVISAHWEEAVPTVSTNPTPPMYFDYYGFQKEAYQLQWKAPGDPQLAREVAELLEKAGFKTAENATRGYDHGTFIPLMLAYPKADIPTVQLSLKRGLDPAEHLAMGRALAPLRERGVYIIGSGNSYHNLRSFMSLEPRHRAASEAFDAWLQAAVVSEGAERDKLLSRWQEAPSARACHPREEHLIPLMVAAGAAGATRGSIAWTNVVVNKRMSAHAFGA